MSHSILSASSSARWIACPPSALLNAREPDQSSSFTKEGTEAHLLCEYKLSKAMGLDVKDPRPELEFYNQEMEDCAEDYAQFILEQKAVIEAKCPDPLVLIEQKLDFSWFVPNGYGTGDCLIIADSEIEVIDFKYGMGVEVSAKDNPQMMCYALGALLLYEDIYDIQSIKMTIFQPRIHNISSSTITREELLTWAHKVLAPAAALASKGHGEFHDGEHCRFCKVKNRCRKRAESQLELARYDFKEPVFLEDEEIDEILKQAEQLSAWVSDVKEYVLQQALNGKDWKNWKLVEGRSIRKFISEKDVAEIVAKAGYNPYQKKLLTITEMTRMLGKEKFNDLLKDQVMKPRGKPVLAARSDKRKEISAIDDFKGEEE